MAGSEIWGKQIETEHIKWSLLEYFLISGIQPTRTTRLALKIGLCLWPSHCSQCQQGLKIPASVVAHQEIVPDSREAVHS